MMMTSLLHVFQPTCAQNYDDRYQNHGQRRQQQQQQQQQRQQQQQYRQYNPPEDDAVECRPSNPKYGWEVLDYYELLGLRDHDHKDGNERKVRRGKQQQQQRQKDDDRKRDDQTTNDASIDLKQLRKAYRRQAQLWHPDKISKTNNGTSPDGRKTISTEESNARFAKIAEAYEVLSDSQKRKDYDALLEYCKNRQKHPTSSSAKTADDGPSIQNRLAKMVENLRDPFRLFEDLFYGGGGTSGGLNDDGYVFDRNDPFSYFDYLQRGYQQQRQQQQRPYPNEDPVRVFQQRDDLYDPVTGDAVVRISQTEEYKLEEGPSSLSSLHDLYLYYSGGAPSERYYYRIIAQDFKKRYDPYTASLSLVPITDLYLQEEGYRKGSKQQSSSATKLSIVDSILHPWEFLQPDGRLLTSPNKRYVAGLSTDCELMVTLNHTKEDVVWSSKRSIRNRLGSNIKNSCYVSLKGPHLIVAMGHPHGVGNRILWHNEVLDDEGGGYFEYEDEYGFWHRRQRSYLAQLDNDGSLAVYSVWSLPPDDEGGNVAARAWATAKDWMNGRIRPSENEYGHLYYQHFQESHRRSNKQDHGTTSAVVYKRCIYSTSPMGCFRLGRLLVQGWLMVHFRVKRIMFTFNRATDSWLDMIYEEDDFLYSMKEALWKNGQAIGSKMANSSARFVRMVLQYFVDRNQS